MAIEKSEFAYLCDFVYKRSAIVLDADKEYLVEARLGPLARSEGFVSIEALIRQLRAPLPNALQKKVIETMTTHETTFFRDLHPFEAFKAEIIPAMRKARERTKTITILCAACSSGQEPYSVAMFLREHFADLASWSVQIIATDLSTAVLDRARAGKFHQVEINRGLPAVFLVKYFERSGADWQIKPEIRKLVEFRQMNLIEMWPALPRIDVFFLRNVLIYFDVPTKQKILARVRQSLAPDGCLFLGAAETTMNIDDTFDRIQVGKAVFYRPGQGAGKATK
jgi:chemotaxis protein methyltransferase CheR